MKMTDDEIRADAAQRLTDERNNASKVTETTPQGITAEVERFAATLSETTPLLVPVIDDACGRYGWCSDGVRLKVEADGGEAVYGWTIWEWASALLTAEFHCVWRSPDGILFDITPKPRFEKQIVFVPDPTRPADFDFDLRPRNSRMNIYGPKAHAARLERLKASLTPSKQAYETRRAEKSGLSPEAWLEEKTGADPVSEAVDALIKACDAFEAHYDALGMSGHVAIDRKFEELHLTRIAAQKRFAALVRTIPGPAI